VKLALLEGIIPAMERQMRMAEAMVLGAQNGQGQRAHHREKKQKTCQDADKYVAQVADKGKWKCRNEMHEPIPQKSIAIWILMLPLKTL